MPPFTRRSNSMSLPLSLEIRNHQGARIGRTPRHDDQRKNGKNEGQHQEQLIRNESAGELLQAQLIGIEKSKENCTEKCLSRLPGAEHHESDTDPAAAVDHVEIEGVEGRHGEKAAPQT